MIERTLCIIKPDAVRRHNIGAILKDLGSEGLHPVAMTMSQYSIDFWADFYAEHQGKPFYENLIEFMSEGPIVALILEGEDAIKRYRQLLGASDPRTAEKGTLRHTYGTDTPANALHGSDSSDAADREIYRFFG